MFLCSIGFAVQYGVTKDSTDLINLYTSISINSDVSEERRAIILEDLYSTNSIEKEIRGVATTEGLCKLIIFNSFCWTFHVNETKDIEYVLESINGELIEGNIPTNPGEILISEDLRQSLNKDIGDYVSQNERIPIPYKISGIYRSEHNIFIGYNYDDAYKEGYIFRIAKHSIDDLYHQMNLHHTELTIINERDQINDILNSIFSLLKILGIVILFITAFEVTSSVSNLNRVYFSERATEFALLQAVGYSEKFVLKRMLKELMLIIFVGLLGGTIIGQFIMTLFYYLYCQDKGIPYRIFEPGLILFATILTMIIFVLSYAPIKKTIKKMDWVEVIGESVV